MFEYERLKQNYLFPTIKGNNISNNTITIFVHNARSLSKHMDDIVSDDRIINNDITGFTETQINPWDSTWKIIETLNFFIIYFNNNENNFLNLANRCKNNAAIFDKFDSNGVSIFSFKEHASFANRVLTLMLVCRKQSMQMQEFSQMLQYLVATYSIDVIAGNFNYVLLKVLENKLLDCFTDDVQIVNKPTHLCGSLIDHVCLKKNLIEEFFTNSTVENIYFSDHDAIKNIIEKNAVDFHTIP